MKHFRLKQRQIHVRRTFRRATLARETVAQRSVELGGFQRIVSVCSQFERGPNDVGAAACGHHFIMCRDERRAHDAALLEAAAAAIALLEVAEERPVFEREREHWLKWKLERASKILSEVSVNPGRDAALRRPVGAARRPYLENFSRVKNIFGIERSFDFAHHFQQLIAKLVAHIFGARDANAVLSGQRTFELTHQRGSFVCDLPEFFQIGGAVHIEHRSHMQKSAGGMPVIARRQPERSHD